MGQQKKKFILEKNQFYFSRYNRQLKFFFFHTQQKIVYDHDELDRLDLICIRKLFESILIVTVMVIHITK